MKILVNGMTKKINFERFKKFDSADGEMLLSYDIGGETVFMYLDKRDFENIMELLNWEWK